MPRVDSRDDSPPLGRQAANYLASLPERVLRSLAALSGGLLNEIGEAALPVAIRRTRLYRTMVEAILRLLVEQLGQVEGTFPAEGRIAEDFLLRRTAGNGIELIGILTFRASPVWILAALADVSGAGRTLIGEIADSLREEGLIRQDAHPATMDQVLDALEEGAGRAAEAINTPPLDVAGLRREWRAIQASLGGLQPSRLPALDRLEASWSNIRETAAREGRSVFEISSLVALRTMMRLPGGVLWLGRSARVAAKTTGDVLVENLLEHYSDTLAEIRSEGLGAWWLRQFRPYLLGAAAQFSPRHRSWTERFLAGKSE